MTAPAGLPVAGAVSHSGTGEYCAQRSGPSRGSDWGRQSVCLGQWKRHRRHNSGISGKFPLRSADRRCLRAGHFCRIRSLGAICGLLGLGAAAPFAACGRELAWVGRDPTIDQAFMRHMSSHHEQGILLASIAAERAGDPHLRGLSKSYGGEPEERGKNFHALVGKLVRRTHAYLLGGGKSGHARTTRYGGRGETAVDSRGVLRQSVCRVDGRASQGSGRYGRLGNSTTEPMSVSALWRTRSATISKGK